MTSSLTRLFVIGATVPGGLLAGVAVDRSLVQFPAWRQIGPVAWAEFTRAADIGRGLILYPAQGIGALLCSVAAAVAFGLNRASPRGAALPIYGAAAMAIAALCAWTPVKVVLNREARAAFIVSRQSQRWIRRAALSKIKAGLDASDNQRPQSFTLMRRHEIESVAEKGYRPCSSSTELSDVVENVLMVNPVEFIAAPLDGYVRAGVSESLRQPERPTHPNGGVLESHAALVASFLAAAAVFGTGSPYLPWRHRTPFGVPRTL